MAKTRTDQLTDCMRALQSSSDIEGSAVVSADGLILVSALPNDTEEDRVSAMSAAMLSLGERIGSELKRGEIDEIFVHGKNGYVVLMSAGQDAVLSVLARQQAKLGLALLDMRRTSETLAKLI